MMGLSEWVTRLRFGIVEDEYGNEVRGVASAVTYQARLEQTASTEITQDRATYISDWLLFLPPRSDIHAGDQIKADGAVFEVLGPPNILRTPSGAHHIEARLRHVS